MRQIDGLREDAAQQIVSVRDDISAGLKPHLFSPPLASTSIPPLDGEGGSANGRAGWGEAANEPPTRRTHAQIAQRADLPTRGRYEANGTLYRDMRDLWRRSGVGRANLERLASADAFRSLGLDRRQALWDVRGLPKEIPLPLFEHANATEAGSEPKVTLPVMPLSEHVVNDYRTLRLSLKAHPMRFLRARFTAAHVVSCAHLKTCRDGARISVAGVVLVRQRPGSAQGVVFMTLEDETGIANSVVWPKVMERERKIVMGARLIVVHGRVQRHEDIIHVVAGRLEDRSDWLQLLTEDGETLSTALANADEVRRPWREERRNHGPPRGHPRDARIIPKSRDFH